MSKELLTSADLMMLLQISEATLWRKVKRGDIPAPATICGLKRWHAREVAALIHPVSMTPPRIRVRRAG